VLRIGVEQVGGDMKVARKYRVGLVTDDGTTYSPWTSKPVLEIQAVPDRVTVVDPEVRRLQ
jgi:hypothetical protein